MDQQALEARNLLMVEAKGNVDTWLKFMTDEGLRFASFAIIVGDDDGGCVKLGYHCQVLKDRGCKVISHSAFPVGQNNFGHLLLKTSLLVERDTPLIQVIGQG